MLAYATGEAELYDADGIVMVYAEVDGQVRRIRIDVYGQWEQLP